MFPNCGSAMVSSLNSCGLRQKPTWWKSEPTATTASLVGICKSVCCSQKRETALWKAHDWLSQFTKTKFLKYFTTYKTILIIWTVLATGSGILQTDMWHCRLNKKAFYLVSGQAIVCTREAGKAKEASRDDFKATATYNIYLTVSLISPLHNVYCVLKQIAKQWTGRWGETHWWPLEGRWIWEDLENSRSHRSHVFLSLRDTIDKNKARNSQ